MGWQDRDYAREDEYRQARPGQVIPGGIGGLRLTTLLIIINVAVFVINALLPVRPGWETPGGFPIMPQHSAVWQFGAMSTPLVLNGEVWRLFTSQYLHGGTMHLFFNMLALFFLGPYIEQLWGKRRFFIFYTVCGLAGNVFYVILNLLGWLSPLPMVGASGCILGVLGACAVLFPGITLLIYFFPMRIRTAATLFLGLYVLNLIQQGPNAGGDAAHLAGIVVGGGIAYFRRGGQAMSSGIPGMARRVRARTIKPRRQRRDPELERRVDAILDKIKRDGMNSLTNQERELLSRASSQQKAGDRADDARFGRTDRL